MSCRFEEDLTAFLDQELAPARADELRAHLAGCASCPPTLALLRGGIDSLAGLPELAPSAELRRSVLRRIDQEPLGWRARLAAFWRPRVLVPAFALGAAVLIALVVANRRGDDAELLLEEGHLEIATHLEVLEDLELAGLERPEDLEVIEHLDELEATP